MSELPTPISDQDKLLSNIAIGIPDIEDLIPNSRQEVYLKYIALNGIHELPVSISQGGTGATTSEEARENLGISLPIPIANGGTGATTATEARTNLEVWKEYSLYSNSSGTYGTITLSDSYKNYKKIVVYFNDNGAHNTATLYTDIGSKLSLSNTYLYTSGTGYYEHCTLIAFIDTSVSFSRNGMVALNEDPTIDVTLSSEAGIRINKVVGYKY